MFGDHSSRKFWQEHFLFARWKWQCNSTCIWGALEHDLCKSLNKSFIGEKCI
jgi:hypothetical protein